MRYFFTRPLISSLMFLQILAGTMAVTLALCLYYGVNTRNGPFGVFELISGWRDDSGLTMRSVFTDRDIEGLVNDSPDVLSVAILGTETSASMKTILLDGLIYEFIEMAVVSPAYFDIMDITPLQGSFFTKSMEGKDVVVISVDAAKELFGNANPVGKTFEVLPNFYTSDSPLADPRIFEIIGTFSSNLTTTDSFEGFNFTSSVVPNILYPIWLADDKLFSSAQSTLVVKSRPGRESQAKEQILTSARIRYNKLISSSDAKDGKDFFISKPGQATIALNDSIDPSLILFLLFGIISFIILTIGTFSMALVQNLDRKREFGIKRALGATRQSIFVDVALGSILLSLVASVIGVVIIAKMLPTLRDLVGETLFLHTELKWHLPAAFFSTGLNVILGVLLNLFPVWRLISLNPVEALVSE